MNFDDLSRLPGLDALFGEGDDTSEIEDTVVSFLEDWSNEDYDSAYAMLASNSPLREGLQQREWVERRQAWARQARPARIRFNPVYENERDEDTSPQQVEVFFSLELADVSTAASPKELPIATISFPDTGRRWYWARFTLVAGDEEEWLIQDITDLGGRRCGCQLKNSSSVWML